MFLTDVFQAYLLKYVRAGEIIQWLRTLATLTEEQTSVPSTHIQSSQLPVTQDVCRSDALSGLCQATTLICTYAYTYIYIKCFINIKCHCEAF